jgi:hypothetical protein
MGYTPDQRRTNIVASAYGYRTAIDENSVPLSEFSVGSGVIILTKKGEPIMSGPISEIRLAVAAAPDGPTPESGALKVGNRWFSEDNYCFRRL